MTSSKHDKQKHPTDADLKKNPGIKSSRGMTGEDQVIEGENTHEGDRMNDTTPEGGVDPNQRGRTNK